MRCRACNAMMPVIPIDNGASFEDLCSRCRGWVYSASPPQWGGEGDSCMTSLVANLAEFGILVEVPDEEDQALDRNHDEGFLDEY